MLVLREVARRVVEQNLPHVSCLLVVDRYTVTSPRLEVMSARCSPGRTTPLAVPAALMSRLLHHSFRYKNPKLDIVTWGEIFGVLHLDTVYDPFDLPYSWH